MKLAKLEIKMIVALFVIGYEYNVCDSKGGSPEKLPVPDYNDIHMVRIPGSRFCTNVDCTNLLHARRGRRVVRVLSISGGL
jgi:hypothetical protein